MFGCLSDSLDKNAKGIGLGLFISEKIVKMFSGKFTLESELGAGSKFGFRIQLSNQEEDISIEQAQETNVKMVQDSNELIFSWSPKDCSLQDIVEYIHLKTDIS